MGNHGRTIFNKNIRISTALKYLKKAPLAPIHKHSQWKYHPLIKKKAKKGALKHQKNRYI